MTDQTGIARQPAAKRELSFETISEMTSYSLPQLAMIRHNMASSMKVAPDKVPLYDLALFCHSCQALGLDPLVKQAYWISRAGTGGLQVGIDGYRAIADRAGNYAGSSEPVFRSRITWQHRGRDLVVPEYCQVTTWKIVGGVKCAFVGEARWLEYVPRVNGAGAESDMWARMPHNQLAKCAEAASLRKGWPAQLGQASFDEDTARQVSVERVAEEPKPWQQPGAPNYDTIYAEDVTPTTERRPQPALGQRVVPPNVDPETGEVFEEQDDEALPFEADRAEAMGTNRRLLQAAEQVGVKGLAKYVANDQWPLNAIIEANVALEAKIMARNGDVELAARQAAVL